ncbi:MAG TPA: hypothetical protein VFX76_05070, partial [Roseiflexaceae bacterium]|nr:hypothetical protein [Roseiflexaceae bacterium]
MYSPMICDVQSPSLAHFGAFSASAAPLYQRDRLQTPGYASVVNVQPVGDGADWVANGAALRAALSSATAGPNQRCLVRLAAGVFDLGTQPLPMRAFVDLEGAGETSTRLLAQVGRSDGGTIVGADDAELRCLSVSNIGGGECAIAIYNNACSPRLSYVHVEASGGLSNYAIYNTRGAAPQMAHVNAIAAGRRCNIGIFNDSAAPSMRHVSAMAAGGALNYGLYNCNGAKPILAYVAVTAAGGERNVGVFNDQGSAPNLASVTARALGGVSSV